MLNIKTPKYIQSTLYEETEEYYQKNKKKYYQKTCTLFKVVRYQNAKLHAKKSILKKKRTLPKTLMNVFFFTHFLTYENSKTHAKRLY